ALHIGLEKVGEPGLWQVHLFEEQWLLANAADPLEKYDPITRLELQRPCYGFVCSLRPGGDQPGVGIEPSTAHLLREAGERGQVALDGRLGDKRSPPSPRVEPPLPLQF